MVNKSMPDNSRLFAQQNTVGELKKDIHVNDRNEDKVSVELNNNDKVETVMRNIEKKRIVQSWEEQEFRRVTITPR